MDRGEAVVSAAHAVAASFLEMIQERGDQRRVELVDVQLAGFVPVRLVAKASSSRNVWRYAAIVFGLAPRWATSLSVK